MPKPKATNQKQNGSAPGFEAQLRAAADKMRGHMDASEYHINAASTGTKMPRANWNDISHCEVALPPKQLAADFTEKIRPLVERIIANIHESRTLAALRDALLPKLLSGELRVPAANPES